jgi:hypothetical protein
MPRSRRNQVHICDLGYNPGVTPLVAPPATTPECEPHTPRPEGYVQHSDWADIMLDSGHDTRQCKGCGLWLIWEMKGSGDA